MSFQPPDFGKLTTALAQLATQVHKLTPQVASLESLAQGVQKQAPATGSSFAADLAGFDAILTDVVAVVGLLAKIEILEEAFSFSTVASDLAATQKQVQQLATQAKALDAEVAKVDAALGEIFVPTDRLSSQLADVGQKISGSWQPSFSAMPAHFATAESANRKDGGKLSQQIAGAASIYESVLSAAQPTLDGMNVAVGEALSVAPSVSSALGDLAAPNSSLDETRALLEKADALLQAVDAAKSQFDLVGQMVEPLTGLLGALNVLVTGDRKIDPADPSTKQEIEQAIAAFLPFGKLLASVDSTLQALEKDASALTTGATTFSQATSTLLTGMASMAKDLTLSTSDQQALEALSKAVSVIEGGGGGDASGAVGEGA